MKPGLIPWVASGGQSWASFPAAAETRGCWTSKVCCLAAFTVGIVQTTTIQLIGAMPVGEFVLIGVCLAALLTLLVTRRWPWIVPAPRILTLFVAGQAVAIASYILTDLWRESATVDLVRGWLRMIFVLLDVTALAMLCGVTERAFVWLQAGVALSFLQLLISPPLFGDYWKFGFAFPITMIVFLLAPRFAGFWGGVVGAASLGALHASLDFRSLGAECVAVGFLLLLRTVPKKVRRVILVAIALGVAICSPLIVDKMFSSHSARANRSNVERSAMLQSAWEGFLASPLVGQGSWFSRSDVMDQFLLIRAEKAQAAGGGCNLRTMTLRASRSIRKSWSVWRREVCLGARSFSYTASLFCGRFGLPSWAPLGPGPCPPAFFCLW